MNKKTQIILSVISFIIGLTGFFINPILSIVGIFCFMALLFFITDYARVVYLLTFFFILDYLLRSVFMLTIVSSIWDELLLIGALLLFIIKYIYDTKTKKHVFTPVDIPMIVFILINLFILIINSTYMEVAVEGFRAVTTNLLWFFLVFSLVKDDKGAKKVLSFVVASSVIIALYGVFQYVTGVEMPAGWVDAAELGVSTRAFSFVQSPNILGAIMTLTSMIAVGLFFYEKKKLNKLFYLASFAVMLLCLVFTLSRGAWIGFAVSLFVFVLLKDKRYILPVLAIGIIVILFVPAVSSRVLYMISPEYIFSSLTGGRMLRWIEGFDLFKENFLTGVGLGHFGGAVAMHYPNYFPKAFYMDNYFLKTAVETGILGVTSFIVLLYAMLSSIFKNVKLNKNTPQGDLLLALFSGLFGVTVHCFFENIFEVPGMITLFWMVAACAMVMIYKKKELPGQAVPLSNI
ncbi:MAG: O-antigen ligase family protein [Clostridia bacterium]|nr:O-antigen ligase family protein [Clostridia bacterium]